MRFWIDHRFEEETFAESLRAFVRNTPWWGISAVAHLFALLVLWQIPVDVAAANEGPRIEAVIREPDPEIEKPKDQVPSKPDIPVPVTEPVDVPDVPTSDDTDDPFNKPEGKNGERSGPTEASFSITPIGVGPGGSS